MPTAHRRGSTLLELLVVIAVIAVLTGLLLAGVQKVRSAAAKITCGSRMRQINLACAQYHDTQGYLPTINGSLRRREDFAYLGWLPRLLPYVEQENAWGQLVEDYRNRPYPMNDMSPHRGVSANFPVFTCPSDERTSTTWSIPSRSITRQVAFSPYLGNSGTSARLYDGVIYHGSRTQLLHVSDGTSTTVLFGERPPSPDLFYGWWYSGVGMGAIGLLDFTVNSRERKPRTRYPGYRACPDGTYHFEARKLDDFCGVFHYWSLHGGGANFAFCDGSVRFLRYEADAILPALMTRAGGEVVPAE